MATSNLYKVNASKYYVLTCMGLGRNAEGIMEEMPLETWQVDYILDDIFHNGIACGFTIATNEWNTRMNAKELSKTEHEWETFAHAGITDTYVQSVICTRSGYYSGIILDYDIMLENWQGEQFYLSQYNHVEHMIDDYMQSLKNIVEQANNEQWNAEMFNLQANNIRTWISNKLQHEINNCETFCKSNCDMEIVLHGVFSNGETIYRQAN